LPDAQSLVDIEAAAEAKNKFQKNLCLLASILYRKLEKHLLPIATKIQAVSCVDQRYLQGFVPAADIELIPTFIPKDAELFDTGSVAKTREPSVILPRPYGRGLLWFLEKVCPLLDKMVPDLRISIVSQRIPVEAENIIAKRANVSYIHWVEDFNTELARHHAVVLTEMSGTGLSTRVLIALALGCAVIGTAKSFRGMSFQDGQHCLIRGDPKSFAEAIVSVVKSRELATRLGQSGKKAAIEQYSYSKVMSDTYSLYLKAIRKFHKNSFQERDRSVYSCR
jgi:glycosyltransferase involved in cell wall biosynthesis